MRRSENAISALGLGDEDQADLSTTARVHIRGTLPDSGTPAYLVAKEAGAPPILVLQAREAGKFREKLADSARWLGLLAVAAALALMPQLTSRLRPFWPEPLLLLGIFGWYLSGLTVFAALFVALGAGGRLLSLATFLTRFLRPGRPAPAAGTPTVLGSGS